MALQDDPDIDNKTGKTSADNILICKPPLDRATGISRRGFVAVAGTTVVTASAGCTTVGNWIADLALRDVTIFNETDRAISGTIEVSDPTGETPLSESFDLDPTTDDDENDDSEATASYDDVWEDAGDYGISLVLADDTEIRGESEKTGSVTIKNPEEEMLAIPLGTDDVDAGIAFGAGDEWSEFHDEG